jgi:hypothetical protein
VLRCVYTYLAHLRFAVDNDSQAARMRRKAEIRMSIKLRKGTDETGRPIYLIERMTAARSTAGAVPAQPCSMLGPDHEQLAPDGTWFRGVHSGKRYKLDA